MSTNQLFFAVAGLFVGVVVAQMATVKWYLDAKFQAIDDKFKSVDGQLKFLMEHAFSHAERLATLEAKSK